ncbi:MAG: heavy metal-binding domain-containing protein, partial [Gammaproteobacteria bacterium]
MHDHTNPHAHAHKHAHGESGCCHASGMHAPSAAMPAGKTIQFTCPMHPEVIADRPGACPKCGMALEPVMPAATVKQLWTCPMHPQIVRDAPGACPICGMALEPMMPAPAEEANPELRSMTLRFWVGTVLTAPLVIVAMRAWFMRPW